MNIYLWLAIALLVFLFVVLPLWFISALEHSFSEGLKIYVWVCGVVLTIVAIAFIIQYLLERGGL